jgi:hypothetical protein
MLRPAARLLYADTLDTSLLNRVSASVMAARSLSEFGGYRATSTEKPILSSISAVQEYAV